MFNQRKFIFINFIITLLSEGGVCKNTDLIRKLSIGYKLFYENVI